MSYHFKSNNLIIRSHSVSKELFNIFLEFKNLKCFVKDLNFMHNLFSYSKNNCFQSILNISNDNHELENIFILVPHSQLEIG